MEWKEIGRSLVSQGAPVLGGLLGGPAGATAGKIVAGLFGSDPDSPEEVMNAIAANPAAMQKIKEYEAKHEEELQRLQIRETELFLSDLDSARKREIETTKATGKKDKDLYRMAYIVIGSFFAITLYLLYAIATAEKGNTAVDALKEHPLAMIIIGALISGFTQVLSYFFGSSKGSSEKNKMMIPQG